MTDTYDSSISFGSRVGSKYIEHNTYTVIISNFRLRTTSINGTLHKHDLKGSIN